MPDELERFPADAGEQCRRHDARQRETQGVRNDLQHRHVLTSRPLTQRELSPARAYRADVLYRKAT